MLNSGKTWAETLFFYQDWIITIFKTQVLKKVFREIEEKSQIVAIFNKYKDILDDFNNSSDIKSLDKFNLIDKGQFNPFKFENRLIKARPKFDWDF